MGVWSPREAAEYRAAADAQLLRWNATDAAARRGIHRLVGIARTAGYMYGDIALWQSAAKRSSRIGARIVTYRIIRYDWA